MICLELNFERVSTKKGTSIYRNPYFTAINSSSVRTVEIDTELLLIMTSTGEELAARCRSIKLTLMSLNDLEPSSPRNREF